jgi:hypothetical protein
MAVMVQRGVIERTSQYTTDKVTFTLSIGSTRSINRKSQTIRVHSGFAWISLDREDIVLKSGDTFNLGLGEHPVVLSALEEKALIYSLE